jgi:hypothetical protein
MTKFNYLLLAGGVAALLCTGATQTMAQDQGGGRQGRGNFDPAQFQQRMMERYKETLEITDDAEWKAIQPLIQKVSEARMAMMGGMGRGMFGRGGGPGGGNQGGQQQRGGFGQPNPEAEALQKAIDAKASSADLKAALQKFVDARKLKQAALEKAQADLRKVLTPRQEAIATASNLL